MTDLQRIYPVVIFAFLIILCGFVAGCTNTSPTGVAASPTPLSTTSTNSTVEKVEILHFHGNYQCTSCGVIGDLAEKTINANFKDELVSGRVVFAHVNYDLPENAALTKKYNVTGSSLWIGVYDANGFHKEQERQVLLMLNKKDAYSTYLSGIITRRLNGDFS